MTESCHFNDKNSLGGSFYVWKGITLLCLEGGMIMLIL